MGRVAKQNELCKTNLEKVVKCINKLVKSKLYSDENISFIHTRIKEIILRDVRMIKECSEKSITEFYLSTLIDKLNTNKDFYNDIFWEELTANTRDKLANKYTGGKTFDNNVDIYFNEVKAEYIRHPMGECNDLEFIPENYDIFIKNNLKTVIECAKRYQNLGLTFEDLIQAGNVGLLTALEKYDKNKANLRIKLLKLLQ